MPEIDDAEKSLAYTATLEVQAAWATGERTHARWLAKEALEHWPGYFAYLERYTQEELVHRVDAARGDRVWTDDQKHVSYEEEQRVNTFLLAKYEPQHIAGVGKMFPGASMLREALSRDIPE